MVGEAVHPTYCSLFLSESKPPNWEPSWIMGNFREPMGPYHLRDVPRPRLLVAGRKLQAPHFTLTMSRSPLCMSWMKKNGSEFECSNVQMLESYLVGGFNPSEKYESIIGTIFPNICKKCKHKTYAIPPISYGTLVFWIRSPKTAAQQPLGHFQDPPRLVLLEARHRQ